MDIILLHTLVMNMWSPNYR